MNKYMKNKVVYGWFHDEEIFYIGIGSITRSKSNKDRNRHCFYKRTKAEREGTFEIRILYSGLTWDQACEIECQLIQEFGRIDNGTGTLTNMTDGGEGSLGHIQSDEHKMKISNKLKGIKRSLETRQKIREANTGENSHRYGKLACNRKRVSVKGTEFESITLASKSLNISVEAVRKRIKSNNFTDHFYI